MEETYLKKDSFHSLLSNEHVDHKDYENVKEVAMNLKWRQ